MMRVIELMMRVIVRDQNNSFWPKHKYETEIFRKGSNLITKIQSFNSNSEL